MVGRAIRSAGLEPGDLDYIEAHGTGTALGDPIEIAALKRAFAVDGTVSRPCAIGSIKSNVGHLESAAGVAGLTKVLLQLQYGELVPSLHAETLNPNLDLDGSPFVVQRQAAPWPDRPRPAGNEGDREPRRCGVSGFGAGGANAHIVLEEHFQSVSGSLDAEGPWIFVLSARNAERLTAYAARFLGFLESSPDVHLGDLAYTMQVGREAMRERLAIVFETKQQLVSGLVAFVGGSVATGVYRSTDMEGQPAAELHDPADPHGLAMGWAKGQAVDWQRLHEGRSYGRLSLPLYPFAQDRYWVDVTPQVKATALPTASGAPAVETPAPVPVPSVAKATPGPSPHRSSVGEPGSARAVIADVLAAMGISIRDEIYEAPLDDLGISSISLIQLIPQLLERLPFLDSERDGDMLLQCRSIAEWEAYIELVSRGWAPSDPAPEPSTPEELREKALDADELLAMVGKKDRRNMVTRDLRISTGTPSTCRAVVVVDESHPFYFDHPLDHVSGMHLAEAINQVARVADRSVDSPSSDPSRYVSRLQLRFPSMCEKQGDAVVHAELDAAQPTGSDSARRFNVDVRQQGRLTAAAVIEIRDGGKLPSPGAEKLPVAVPIDQKIVRKVHGDNVLLGRLQQENGSGTAGSWLIRPPEEHCLRDYPHPWIDILVLAEACRQGARAFGADGIDPSEQGSLGASMVPILESLTVSVSRPLAWNEAVFLTRERYDTVRVGSNLRLELEGRFVIGGEPVGTFQVTTLILNRAVFQRFQEPSTMTASTQ